MKRCNNCFSVNNDFKDFCNGCGMALIGCTNSLKKEKYLNNKYSNNKGRVK